MIKFIVDFCPLVFFALILSYFWHCPKDNKKPGNSLKESIRNKSSAGLAGLLAAGGAAAINILD